MLSQVSRSFSFVRRAQNIRGFSSSNQSGSGKGGFRGDTENKTSSTNQTSNAPNYGTSNQTGGRFTGSTNNFGNASNTTSPASASKATSNSGTSQFPSSGSASKIDKTTQTESTGSTLSSFFKSAFGTGTSGKGETNSTLPNSPNAASIPSNSTTLNSGINQGVNASASNRSSASVDYSDSKAAVKSNHDLEENYDEDERASEFDDDFPLEDYERARLVTSFGNVSTRYAFLLWSEYKSDNALETLDSDLEKFFNDVDSHPELLTVFDEDLLVTEKNRSDAIEKYLASSPAINEKLAAFLLTVSEYRRLSNLKYIFQDIEVIRNKVEKKMHTAVVTSATPLSETQKQSIKAIIDSTFSPDGEVDIQEEIKPDIGGGYEIYYDGEYHLDNTEKSMIGVLENEIDSAITGFISKDANESH